MRMRTASVSVLDNTIYNYNMRGLEEDSRYIITVTAFYSDKIGAVNNTVTVLTLEAGIRELNIGLLYFCFHNNY